MKAFTLFLATLWSVAGCGHGASIIHKSQPITSESAQTLHTDVLALAADRGLETDAARAKNWFRHYDADTGIWRQASAAGSITPWRDMEAAAGDYMRKTHRGDYTLRYTLHHAYLRALVYEPPPPPEGFSRMDGPDVVLWYDTFVKRIVAETY